jgi:hypothetical protein
VALWRARASGLSQIVDPVDPPGLLGHVVEGGSDAGEYPAELVLADVGRDEDASGVLSARRVPLLDDWHKVLDVRGHENPALFGRQKQLARVVEPVEGGVLVRRTNVVSRSSQRLSDVLARDVNVQQQTHLVTASG